MSSRASQGNKARFKSKIVNKQHKIFTRSPGVSARCGQRTKDVGAIKSSITAAAPYGAPEGNSGWRKTGYWT